MARLGRNLVAVVLFVALGSGAYAARDRWLPSLMTEIARQRQSATQSPNTETPGGRNGGGQGGGGRRGGRFGGAAQGPISVLAVSPQTKDIPVTVTGVGTAMPMNTVTVHTQVDGQLIQLLFREGQDVKKGDVLAKIDDRAYKAQLDQAIAKRSQDQATLDNAKHDLERYTNLAATNSVTKQQLDTQRSTVAQTEALVRSDDAAIANVQVTLSYTSITAPIDGRTGIRNVDVGNLLHASDTTGIVTISQIQPIALVFTVPQQFLAAINKASAEGALSVDVLNGSGAVVDHGTLLVVDNQIDPTTGTVKLKASSPNSALALWPGAFANARLLISTLKNATVVPTAAVQRGPDGAFVYLLKDDQTVTMKKVAVGQQDDQEAVITDGLTVSDKVITTGFVRLTEGAKVAVADANKAPAADAIKAPAAATTDPTAEPGQRQHKHQRRNGTPADDSASPAPNPAP